MPWPRWSFGRRMKLSILQMQGVTAACLCGWDTGGLSGESCALNEALSTQGKGLQEDVRRLQESGCTNRRPTGSCQRLCRGECLSSTKQGRTTEDYTWTRAEWRLPGWGRPEVCDFSRRRFLLVLQILQDTCSQPPGWRWRVVLKETSEPVDPEPGFCTKRKSWVTTGMGSLLPAWLGCLKFVAFQKLRHGTWPIQPSNSLHITSLILSAGP